MSTEVYDTILKRVANLEQMATAMLNEAKSLRRELDSPKKAKKKGSPAVAALIAKAKIKYAVKERTA